MFQQLFYKSNLRFTEQQLDAQMSNLRFAEQQLDPAVVPRSVNCFYNTIGETPLSHKNQFGDRGPNDPGLGCATSARLPEYAAGGWKIQYPLSVLLKGTMANGRFSLINRPGFEPTVRIDIYEGAAF